MKRDQDIEQIFAFLGAIRPLSPKCKAHLRKVIQYKKLSKKDILLKIGDVNKDLYFIKKGSLECFHYHKEKEIYDWFFFETDTVVSPGSFYNRVPSVQCIQAPEEVEVYYIAWQDYEYLKWHYGEFAYIACSLLEKYIVIFSEHAMLNRDQKSFEKFGHVLEKMPQLLQRIEHKKIATWMNMDPATLSRNKMPGKLKNSNGIKRVTPSSDKAESSNTRARK
jgi:signal-transduction protein with cAMP-binding, CBS, and nucleotidyltransferase domain